MYVGRKGYSTVLVATILFAIAIVAGGTYYLQAKARMALLPRKQLIYPSINPPKNASLTATSEQDSKVCPILEKNPGLYARFTQTQATPCGEQNKDNKVTDSALLANCISQALKTCTETKTYIYQEHATGYSENLITTHDCELFVDSWSTAPPQCGVKYSSCKALDGNFPQEICTSSEQNLLVLPTRSIQPSLTSQQTQSLQQTPAPISN